MKSKAKKLEDEGAKLLSKGKYKSALKSFKEALKFDPENKNLYSYLIQAHDHLKDEWTDEDFSDSLHWTMKLQELENPALRRIHLKLEPEWKVVSQLIKDMILAKSEEDEVCLMEQLKTHGETALYALCETVLAFKKAHEKGLGA